MAGIDILAVILIIAFILAYILLFYAMIQAGTRSTLGWITTIVAALIGLLLIIYLTANITNIVPADWAQILILLGLVIVTGMYALSTRKQADANVKMAEEMREQRIMTTRPIIVQEAVHGTDQEKGIIWELFSWFEIYNAGNSPTIRLEILLLDKEKQLLEKRTDPLFLRANETVRYSPSSLVSHVGSTCYLLCQYQGVFSHDKGQKWYQTWFSFEPTLSSKSLKPQRGDIIIKLGELIFCEVFEKEDY